MQASFFDGSNKFINDKKIRLIELFGGVGCQATALEYLGIKFEHYYLCDFDKFAVQSYNAIHKTKFKKTDIREISATDLKISETNKYLYIFTYSFPCTDLSKAGKQMGMSKDTGTRSSLLWEVERLLDECKDLPQVLLMENVPDIISEKNMKDFSIWLHKLESLGYKNYYQVLNAKEFGVPQNRDRCFMISLLGDYYYDFPQGFRLQYCLNNFLEKQVDEKYYLTGKTFEKIKSAIKKFPTNIENQMEIDLNSTDSKFRNISNTIKARYDCGYENFTPGPTGIFEIINPLKDKTEYGWHFEQNVYNSNGLTRSLKASEGSGNIPKIIEPKIKELTTNQSQGNRVYDTSGISVSLTANGGGVGAKTGLYLETNKCMYNQYNNKIINDVAPTQPTNCGSVTSSSAVLICESIKTLKEELCEELVESGILTDGTVINHSYTNKNKKPNSRLKLEDYIESQNGICPTLTTRPDTLGYYEDFKIRKLTPTECWRLMGFKDSETNKVIECGMSNAQMYKQAGNGIVVNVLMAIFGSLLNIEWKSKIDKKDRIYKDD